MAFVEGIAEEEASGALANLFAADRQSWGFLPNFASTFGLRPEVYQAWRSLNGAIKANMDPRRYELATTAAAIELRSSYCTLAHGRILADGLMSQDDIIGLVDDPDGTNLTALDRAIVALARKIARAADEVSAEDIEQLRHHGLTDQDIFDVICAATARCFFSKTLDATGTTPDAFFNDLPLPLREALTVGRPIDPREDAISERP